MMMKTKLFMAIFSAFLSLPLCAQQMILVDPAELCIDGISQLTSEKLPINQSGVLLEAMEYDTFAGHDLKYINKIDDEKLYLKYVVQRDALIEKMTSDLKKDPTMRFLGAVLCDLNFSLTNYYYCDTDEEGFYVKLTQEQIRTVFNAPLTNEDRLTIAQAFLEATFPSTPGDKISVKLTREGMVKTKVLDVKPEKGLKKSSVLDDVIADLRYKDRLNLLYAICVYAEVPLTYSLTYGGKTVTDTITAEDLHHYLDRIL